MMATAQRVHCRRQQLYWKLSVADFVVVDATGPADCGSSAGGGSKNPKHALVQPITFDKRCRDPPLVLPAPVPALDVSPPTMARVGDAGLRSQKLGYQRDWWDSLYDMLDL